MNAFIARREYSTGLPNLIHHQGDWYMKVSAPSNRRSKPMTRTSATLMKRRICKKSQD